MSGWRLWEVEVYGYEPEIFTARSRDKARYAAYRAISEHRSWSFHEFLIESSVRLLRGELRDDGYDNVRAQYGVSPRIGESFELVSEGPNSGRRIVVLYPGRHTSMIHAAYEGEDTRLIVHPLNVRRVA